MCQFYYPNVTILLRLLLVFLACSMVPYGVAETKTETPTLKQVLEKPDANAVLKKTDAEVKPQLATEAPPAPPAKKKIPVKVGPDDEYDRGVPRTSIVAYMLAVKENDFERAAQYLDLRRLPRGYSKKDGPELARQLSVVLDRKLWIEFDILSIEPKGHKEDGLASYLDLIGQVQAGEKKHDILLQRVPRGDGVYIWKFSSKTVRKIPALYAAHGYGAIGERLSKIFPSNTFLGLELWQWIFLLLILLAVTVAVFPFVRVSSWLIRRRQTPMSFAVARFINGPFYVLLVIIILRNYFDVIHPSLEAKAIFKAGTIAIIIVTWVVLRLVDIFRDYWVEYLKQNDREHAVVLIKPATTALNIFVVVIAFLVWLDNIGFSITTVIAGLGIGGIAIALATQKSIEHFIGALTLYLAAPIRVGDFCRVGETFGVVEEIGLRSTNLRTLDQTIITIPNGDLVGMPIENYTGRERFRFYPKISLRVDTSPDQIRFILLELQKLLHAHPKIAESPIRARFTGFGSYSLDIEIHSYVETDDFADYLAVKEDLNLRIMDIIQTAGTEIAIPARIEYQDTAHQLNQADIDKVEAQVEQWRSQGQLSNTLPKQQADEIKNTIPYETDK